MGDVIQNRLTSGLVLEEVLTKVVNRVRPAERDPVELQTVQVRDDAQLSVVAHDEVDFERERRVVVAPVRVGRVVAERRVGDEGEDADDAGECRARGGGLWSGANRALAGDPGGYVCRLADPRRSISACPDQGGEGKVGCFGAGIKDERAAQFLRHFRCTVGVAEGAYDVDWMVHGLLLSGQARRVNAPAGVAEILQALRRPPLFPRRVCGQSNVQTEVFTPSEEGSSRFPGLCEREVGNHEPASELPVRGHCQRTGG